MHRVEPSLIRWRKLYTQLGEAQQRLVSACEHPKDGISLGELKADVARLQTESEAALEAIHVQIAAIKAKPGAHEGCGRDRPN